MGHFLPSWIRIRIDPDPLTRLNTDPIRIRICNPALDKSTVGIYAGLMEMEGEGAEGKLRRNPAQPVPDNSEESRLELQARTAYAKGQ